jgi:UDP-glucuronate 4-epimerase
MVRDFTYIDDIVEGVIRVIDRPAQPNPAWSGDSPDSATSYAPYRIFNIGNSSPVELLHYIRVLEECLGKKATMEMLPMQDGDVPSTVADVSELQAATGFRPATTVETGIRRFVDWYREYHSV